MPRLAYPTLLPAKIMSPFPSGIPLSPTPGKDAMRRSIKVETIMLKLRDLAVRATYRSNANYATPDEFKQWATDLRRGQMNIIGSIKRFSDLIDSRHLGIVGQQLKQEAVDLAQEYIDIDAPRVADTPKPKTRVVDISGEIPRVRLGHAVRYDRGHRSA